jgi:RNA polymerase sigma factor (TIGR02999 family)
MSRGDEHEIEITDLLRELSEGAPDALDSLVPLVYRDLRSAAHRQLRGENAGHTLDTTSLVHETYLRLVELRDIQWEDRAHFMAMASRLMRRILIDYSRMRARQKRGGGWTRVSLNGVAGSTGVDPDDLLALDEALRELEAESERRCRVVECRFFAGLTIAEVAKALGLSTGTVKRDWRVARQWLNRRLAVGPSPEAPGEDR